MIFGYYLLDETSVRLHRDYLVYLSVEEFSEFKNRGYSNSLSSAQFVYSRLASRLALSKLTDISPKRISIRSRHDGKPLVVIDEIEHDDLSITISHQKDRVIVGAFRECNCGMDIQSSEGIDWEVVEDYMQWSPGVTDLLGKMQGTEHDLTRAQLLSIMWSCFEASSKSIGRRIDSSSICWEGIRFEGQDLLNSHPIFEVRAMCSSIPSTSRSFALLASDFVIAITYSLSSQ